MKDRSRFYKPAAIISVFTALTIVAVCAVGGVFAETGVKATNSNAASYEIEDTNPAIYVAERNRNSVVGVITNVESWSDRTREVSTSTYSEGSGVCIADGGYIITNYHVVSGGDSYQLLMPSGEIVDAELVGYDSSMDLAVLKVDDDYADQLTPAAIGSVEKLSVGSTVVAIGNPGGQTLSNTVTSGIVSCLERTVDGGNTSRTVSYIQHDAAISSGNSGGGLFDVNGNLVGVNTLKYSGSVYSTSTYEGLGFAIPIDSAYPIAVEIIEEGRVRRLGLGVTVQEVSGADEPTDEETPAGLYVVGVTKDGPAYDAGVAEGDFIIGINDERITTMEDLTDVVDACSEGDTVIVTVARYVEEGSSADSDSGFNRTSTTLEDIVGSYFGSSSDDSGESYAFGNGGYGGYYGFPFGGYGNYGNYYYQQPAYELEILELEVQLEYLN